MTSDQMVSVSPIWQLGYVGKGPDVFAKSPYCDDQFVDTCCLGLSCLAEKQCIVQLDIIASP